MRLRFALCLMATVGLLAGCAAAAGGPPPLAQLPDKVVTAQAAVDTAGLVLTVEAQPAPAQAGYRTQYVRVIDWEVAEASLTNSDGTIPALNRSVPAAVSTTLERTASLYFAPVKPAADYTLSIALKRRDRTGTYQTVASGTRTAITLAPGTNTASVTLSATTAGEVSISAPTPSLTAPTPPEVSTLRPASASVGMLIELLGINFDPTPAGNTLTVNGTASAVQTATATRLTTEIGAGLSTGPVAVTVAGRTAASPTAFTLVPSGTNLGSTGVGASPFGMATDSAGNLWVANSGGTTVTKLSPTGAYLATYYAGTGPLGLKIDQAGTIWVTNYTSPGTVTRLAPDGTNLGSTTVAAYPVDIAFDASGKAWVSAYGENCVTEVSAAGVALGNRYFGVPPGRAAGIAIDGTGKIWVADNGRAKLMKLNADGSTSTSYNTGSDPTFVAIDGAGNVWVSCESSNEVYKFPPGGGVPGVYPTGAATAPRSLAFDWQGNLWICCVGTDRVIKMSPTGTILGTYTPGGNPNGIVFDSFRAANVSLSIANTVVKLAL